MSRNRVNIEVRQTGTWPAWVRRTRDIVIYGVIALFALVVIAAVIAGSWSK